VFRAQAFEGIFALLPILLIAIVSVLVRARSIKKQKQRDETAAPTRAEAAERATAPTGVKAPARPGQKREPTAALPGKPRASAPFMPQQPVRPKGAYREGYIYPPPLPLNNLKTPPAGMPPQPSPVPEIRQPDLRERMESRSGSIGVKEAAVKSPSVVRRLERLPPLKRAVIWSEILGPPGGRQ